MTLPAIKLKNDNVHVRYSADNLNFYPSKYEGVSIALWVLKKSANYAAFEVEKMIEAINNSPKAGNEYIVIDRNYTCKDVAISDCILQSQRGSNQKIDGLDWAIKIAQRHNSVEDLYKDPDLKLSDSKNPAGLKLYEIRGMDYSGTQSTDDSVDEEYQRRKQQDDAAQAAIETASDISDTEKKQVILARHGQGRFRNAVFKLYGARCVLTGMEFADVLIASHIMPWADCKTAEQRLDPHNGLLLDRNLDRLFDRGYITFDEKGVLKISPQLSAAGGQELLPDENIQLDLSPETQGYLEYHRKKIFRKR